MTFHHHEVVGAKLVRKRLRKLKYPKATIEAIGQLVYLHMRFHGFGEGQWTDSAVRRYVTDAGDLLPASTRSCARIAPPVTPRRHGACSAPTTILRSASLRSPPRRTSPAYVLTSTVTDHGDPRAQPRPEVGQAWSYLKELRLEEGPLERDVAIAKLREWWESR